MSPLNPSFCEPDRAPFDPFHYARRAAEMVECGGVRVGGSEVIKVAIRRAKFDAISHKLEKLGDFRPDFVYEDARVMEIDPRDNSAMASLDVEPSARVITVRDGLDLSAITAFRLLAARANVRHPILLKDVLEGASETPRPFLSSLLTASTTLGSLICDGIGDAILVQGEPAPGQSLRLAFNILQASGARIFKTDYVACPSCGRTLFNLQATTARIRAATNHLKGVKIAIMGCIVNGPGEMADADFGYVGGAPGKINLYVGRTAVKFNIPEAEAVSQLVELIKEHGRWFEGAAATDTLAVA